MDAEIVIFPIIAFLVGLAFGFVGGYLYAKFSYFGKIFSRVIHPVDTADHLVHESVDNIRHTVVNVEEEVEGYAKKFQNDIQENVQNWTHHIGESSHSNTGDNKDNDDVSKTLKQHAHSQYGSFTEAVKGIGSSFPSLHSDN